MKSVVKYRIEGEIVFDPTSLSSFAKVQSTLEDAVATIEEQAGGVPSLSVKIVTRREAGDLEAA